MKRINAIIFFLIIFLPELAFAEVSDKVPSISNLWIMGFSLGIIGFFLSRYRIWAGILIGLVSIFFCLAYYDVISDPFVGPAIRNEQGNLYIFSVYGSIVLMLSPLFTGFVIRYLRNKKTT
jgi:hypothetical protein